MTPRPFLLFLSPPELPDVMKARAVHRRAVGAGRRLIATMKAAAKLRWQGEPAPFAPFGHRRCGSVLLLLPALAPEVSLPLPRICDRRSLLVRLTSIAVLLLAVSPAVGAHASMISGTRTNTVVSTGKVSKRWSIPDTLTAITDGTDLLDAEWVAAGDAERVVRRSTATGAIIWASPTRTSATGKQASWVQLKIDTTTGIVYELENISTTTQPYTLRLAAYSDSTGKQLWSLVPPGDAYGQLSLAADRGRVLISTESGNVAYDSSGHQLWNQGLWFGQIPGGSMLSGGRYYSGADVLDPNTGTVLWTWNVDPVFEATSPTVNGNLIMFGGYQVIAWYPASGCSQFSCRALGTVQVSSADQFPPVATGNTTLAWTGAGVEAYSLTTRKLLWKETSDDNLFAYLIANGLVWTSDETGVIRSYNLSGCGHPVCKPTRTIQATHITAPGDLLVMGNRALIWSHGGPLVAVPLS